MIVELIGILLPRAFGWSDLIDAALARTLFSVTLHAIVYFWLMPAYIAFYSLVPVAAGGRLYSDTMGRLAFIMLLVFSLPVGMHHLLMDPEHGSGFKFLQSSLTFLVVLPTLLYGFSRLARAWKSRDAFAAVAEASAGSPRCPGTSRWCSRSDCRWIMLGLGGVWRSGQHELRHECHDPQPLRGHGTFPPALWRCRGDDVLRHRLRDVAAAQRKAAALETSGMRPTSGYGFGEC